MTPPKSMNSPEQKRVSIPTKSKKLRTLSKVSLFGLAFTYSAKIINTFHHGIFATVTVAGTIIVLNILAGIVQLLFFVAFSQQPKLKDKPSLKLATWVAIIGSFIGLFPKFLAVAVVFQTETIFHFIRYGAQVSAFSPWLTAVLLLTFSLIFFLDSEFACDRALKWAFGAGATGWFSMTAAQSLVIINYLTVGQLVWLADLFAAGPIVFVSASSITFLGLVVFYAVFANR